MATKDESSTSDKTVTGKFIIIIIIANNNNNGYFMWLNLINLLAFRRHDRLFTQGPQGRVNKTDLL